MRGPRAGTLIPREAASSATISWDRVSLTRCSPIPQNYLGILHQRRIYVSHGPADDGADRVGAGGGALALGDIMGHALKLDHTKCSSLINHSDEHLGYSLVSRGDAHGNSTSDAPALNRAKITLAFSHAEGHPGLLYDIQLRRVQDRSDIIDA
jgi:hypothetical protein